MAVTVISRSNKRTARRKFCRRSPKLVPKLNKTWLILMHLSVQKLWAANMTQCIINVFITRCVIDVNHQKMPDTKRFRVPHLAFVFVPRGLTVYLSARSQIN
jgi:hypothetical protein